MQGASRPARGSEHRRFPRIRSDVRVRALIPADFPALDSFGRGHDISEGGMAIYVAMDLRPDQEILLVLNVPVLREKLGVRGVVRYAHEHRYGLEFTRLGEQDRAKLRQALAYLESLQPGDSSPADTGA